MATTLSFIQLRRGNASTWNTYDPTLLPGELGYELDTRKIKIGDGSTAWTSLPYATVTPTTDGRIIIGSGADTGEDLIVYGKEVIQSDAGDQLEISSTLAAGIVELTVKNATQQWSARVQGDSLHEFLVSDETNSKVPLKIAPNSATDSISIDSNGVGFLGSPESGIAAKVTGKLKFTDDILKPDDSSLTTDITNNTSDIELYRLKIANIDAAGTAESLNLPASTGSGQRYLVSGTISSGGSVTVNPNGVDTIDGLSSYVQSENGDYQVEFVDRALGEWISIQAGGGGGYALITGTMGESGARGNVFYRDPSTGNFYKGDNSVLSKSIVAGVLSATTSVGNTGTLILAGVLNDLTGLTAGQAYYLGTSGDLVSAESIPSDGYKVFIGRANGTTSLDISVGEPVRLNTTVMPIGRTFTSFSETEPGALMYDYNNAVSQAQYAPLYAKVGDSFEQQHLDAGDPASGAGMFYPTPVPGLYTRAAVAPYSFTDSEVASDSGLRIDCPANWQQDKADLTGRPVRFEVESGTAPGNLVDGTTYYLIPYASTAYTKLATSEANAIAGTAIAYTDSGSGSFRLVQAGIQIDDATQRVTGTLARNSVTGLITADDGVSGVFSRGGSKANRVPAEVSGGFDVNFDNADVVRTSNEDRPSTVYEYHYIQAENVLPSGEPVSAVVATYDWTQLSAGFSATWNHGLGENLSNLILMATLSIDGTEANAIATFYINTDNATATNTHVGIAVSQTDINNLAIDVGNTGVIIIDPTTKNRIDASAYYLKIRAYKPSIVATYSDASPATLTYDISIGDQVSAALPDPTSLAPGTKKSFEWTGGDGTGAFWVGGSYNLWINNKELVPGSAVDGTEIGGHGTGHMTIEVYNSRWNVVKFHDAGAPADAGDKDRYWERDINGRMFKRGAKNDSVTSSTTASWAITFGGPDFVAIDFIPMATLGGLIGGRAFCLYAATNRTISGANFSFIENTGTAATGSVDCLWSAEGRWYIPA